MGESRELHFQEGFAGETVVVSIDGIERARFDARTRLQTGLARIETVDVAPGQVVAIRLPAHRVEATYTVTERDRWITINLNDRGLVIEPAMQRPGYV